MRGDQGFIFFMKAKNKSIFENKTTPVPYFLELLQAQQRWCFKLSHFLNPLDPITMLGYCFGEFNELLLTVFSFGTPTSDSLINLKS